MNVASVATAASAIVCLCGGLAAIACWFGAVFSIFKAAANRKPGVPYYDAFHWINTSLFRRNVHLDDLFNPVGVRWAKRTIYFALGFPTAMAITATAIALSRRFLDR